MANFDEQLWKEKYDRQSDILNEHNQKIENHESRLSEMEKSSIKMEEIIRQNVEQSTKMIQSIDANNAKVSTAIEKLTDMQQDMQLQMVSNKADIDKKMLENKLGPDADKYKHILYGVITAIIALLFTLLQTGVLKIIH